jgi:hypothetical protein
LTLAHEPEPDEDVMLHGAHTAFATLLDPLQEVAHWLCAMDEDVQAVPIFLHSA